MGLLVACSGAAQSPPSAASVVATVGETTVTLDDVDRIALQQMTGNFGNVKLAQALYDARQAALDGLVGDALLDLEAKARGVDRATLVQQEIAAKVSAPTDADVEAWYQANQARLQGAGLPQVRAAILQMLGRERTATARQAFIDTLKTKTRVITTLEAPRLVVKEAAYAPVRGSATARVEIVEFSDFQCPFCRRSTETLKQVSEVYGDRVRLVYRHYPLPNHADARPAAEASACAADQGKFWPYHDRLFATAKLGATDLRQSAADVGLDLTAFDGCVASHTHKAQVDADVEAGEQAGVTGTPAFFVNGRMITGAVPFDVFKRAIDEELQRR